MLMAQVKAGPIPDSLRHLPPQVERPAFKRKKRSYSKSGGATKSGAAKGKRA